MGGYRLIIRNIHAKIGVLSLRLVYGVVYFVCLINVRFLTR